MEITGKLSQVLPTERGTSATGEWYKTLAIFEISSGKYTDKLAVTFFKADPPQEIGASYNIQLNIKSREYSGRWYTEATAWKCTLIDTDIPASQNQPQRQQPSQRQPQPVSGTTTQGMQIPEPDDLPFIWSIPLIPTGIGLLTAASFFA